jgi:hypothetical protein
VGSVYLVDVQFEQCGTVIYTFPFRATETGTTVFTFDNIFFEGNQYLFVYTDGTVLTTFDVTDRGSLLFATIGDIQDYGVPIDGLYTIDFGTRNPAFTDSSSPFSTDTQPGYARRP